MQRPVRELLVDQLSSKAGVTYTVTSPRDGKLLYTIETSEYGEPQVIVTRHTDVPPQPQTRACRSTSSSSSSSSSSVAAAHPGSPPGYNEPPPSYDPPPYHSINRTPNPTRRESFQPTDYLVGTASFNEVTPNIDICLPGNNTEGGRNDSLTRITMMRSNPLSMKRRFPTHSLLGRLAWKEERFGLNGNQRLMDDHKRVIARYVHRWSRLPVQEPDQLLLYLPDQRLDQNLDLIVLTGFASVEYRRQADLEWGGSPNGRGTILPMALVGTGFGFIV